jgi:hypothetical protein
LPLDVALEVARGLLGVLPQRRDLGPQALGLAVARRSLLAAMEPAIEPRERLDHRANPTADHDPEFDNVHLGLRWPR